MIGAQILLKASQAVRSAVPARSVHCITAPAKHKISRAEFLGISAIFIISNFAYPVYVLHYVSSKKRAEGYKK